MNRITKGKYAVLIAAFQSPLSLLFDALQRLSNNPDISVYVIDSSPQVTSKKICAQIDSLNRKQSATIKFFNVPNYGIGHSYNFGMKQAVKDNCDLITLFTDDMILRDNGAFPTERIRGFFYANCRPKKDILILPVNKFLYGVKIEKTVDSGMTFSKELFNTVSFREELVLDQIDFYFCSQILKNGGRFVVYPEFLLDILPVGRITSNGERLLPLWRLYLLTRNTISIDLESDDKITALMANACPQIRHWGISGIKSGQGTLGVFKAIFLGFMDGITKNLGVTSNLQKLSNNRFSKKET